MSKKENYWRATGRRKTSKASVRLTKGSGKIIINNCDYNEYFGRDISKMVMKQPLQLTETYDKYDIFVNVVGGGLSGQAEAIRMGISRALQEIDSNLTLPTSLIKSKDFFYVGFGNGTIIKIRVILFSFIT